MQEILKFISGQVLFTLGKPLFRQHQNDQSVSQSASQFIVNRISLGSRVVRKIFYYSSSVYCLPARDNQKPFYPKKIHLKISKNLGKYQPENPTEISILDSTKTTLNSLWTNRQKDSKILMKTMSKDNVWSVVYNHH